MLNNAIMPLINVVMQILEPAFSFLIDTLTVLWKNVINPLVPIISDVLGGAFKIIEWVLKTLAVPMIETFKKKLESLSPVINVIKAIIEVFGQVVKKVFEKVNENINKVKNAIDFLKQKWKKLQIYC